MKITSNVCFWSENPLQIELQNARRLAAVDLPFKKLCWQRYITEPKTGRSLSLTSGSHSLSSALSLAILNKFPRVTFIMRKNKPNFPNQWEVTFFQTNIRNMCKRRRREHDAMRVNAILFSVQYICFHIKGNISYANKSALLSNWHVVVGLLSVLSVFRIQQNPNYRIRSEMIKVFRKLWCSQKILLQSDLDRSRSSSSKGGRAGRSPSNHLLMSVQSEIVASPNTFNNLFTRFCSISSLLDFVQDTAT